jgi:signal transduction histidine kinase
MNGGAGDDSLKTEFLRALAHDIRSPLGVANGVLGELASASPDEMAMLLPMARRNLDRLAQLAARLDLVAELEEGKLQAQLDACDVAAAVADATRQLPDADGAPQVHRDIDDGKYVAADRELLGRVLGIVLENAMRFARSEVRVRVEDDADDGRICLCVDDDGPGIDAQHVDGLFDRYRSGRARGCDRDLALGLSLARDYVALMGGSLTLERRPEGAGTRCRLTFAAAPDNGGRYP